MIEARGLIKNYGHRPRALSRRRRRARHCPRGDPPQRCRGNRGPGRHSAGHPGDRLRPARSLGKPDQQVAAEQRRSGPDVVRVGVDTALTGGGALPCSAATPSPPYSLPQRFSRVATRQEFTVVSPDGRG